MPLLTNGDLAKELIRRRHTTARDQAVNTTSSYEMVEEEGADNLWHGRSQGRRFWRRRSRFGAERAEGEGQGAQDGGVGNRVVSEPVAPSMKEKMLGRLRFRRASESIPILEGDVGEMSQEMDVTGIETTSNDTAAEELASTPNIPSRAHDHSEAGPSFISFSPAASSVRYVQRRTPPSKRTLAPTLVNVDHSTDRDEAVRAVTLEARLAQYSMSDGADTSSSPQSPEYPSLAYTDPDSSSDIRGILRARNNRAPPNTPTPTVRFADSRLTPIRQTSKQPHAKAQDEDDSLPAAQISGGPRWRRLGVILGAIDRQQPEDLKTYNDSSDVGIDPLDTSTTSTPITNSFSSDSPISFARFDTGDIISSTPLRKPRKLHPKALFTSPLTQLASPLDLNHLSLSPSSTPSSYSDPTWSTRLAEDDAIVENCTALEALWEYGSSEGNDEPALETNHDPDSSPEVLSGTTGIEASASINPVTPRNYRIGSDPAGIVCGSGTLEHRRGSGELLPLKYTGRVARPIEDDPFPFATTLRY